MSENKGRTFLQSALVLLCANLLVKIIGAVFKIPLANMIGKSGMGLFSVAYQIYTFMFVIATAGFPIAVSKMVAESAAVGNEKDARRIFETSTLLLGIVGVIGSTVLFAFAKSLADMLGNKNAYMGIMIIAPAVFFVSLVSAYRGFFQGKQNMYPTAVSEVIEAFIKLVVGYLLASVFMKLTINEGLQNAIDWGARQAQSETAKVQFASSGAVFGVTCGTAMALLALMAIYAFAKKKKAENAGNSLRTRKNIVKELVMIAIPITIGASVSSLTSLIDLATIMNRLVVNPAVFDNYAHVFGVESEFAREALAQGWNGVKLLEEKANALYGMYNGFAIPMFNLPLTIVVALSMSVVPAIAGALAKGNNSDGKRTTESVLRITLLFALPCAVGMGVLSKPILGLLYHDTDAYLVLQKLSFAIAFVALVSVTNAVLQAYGKMYVPVVNMLIGGIVKVSMNYFFIPVWGIDAAPISTSVCYGIIFVLNFYYIVKNIKIKFSITDFIVKPLVSAAVMGVVALYAFDFLNKIHMGEKLSTIGAIGIGGILYVVLIFVCGAVKKEDIQMLPMGGRLADVMTRIKLLK